MLVTSVAQPGFLGTWGIFIELKRLDLVSGFILEDLLLSKYRCSRPLHSLCVRDPALSPQGRGRWDLGQGWPAPLGRGRFASVSGSSGEVATRPRSGEACQPRLLT